PLLNMQKVRWKKKARVVTLNAIFVALGPLDPAIDTASLGDLYLGAHDKTLFGMLIPEIIAHITDSTERVILLGME
ncbi:hypothetical protein MPER_16184, partial [Moniliophthora perniciosa FA553]